VPEVDLEAYSGRLQAYVKHCLLEKYIPELGLFREFRVKKSVGFGAGGGGSIFLLQKPVIFSSAGIL
jgi:hypothetical protein